MSMYNDMVWRTQGNHENCLANSMNVAAYAKKFPLRTDVGHFWDFGYEKKWYGTHVSKSNGEWNKTAEVMMLNFAEIGHPVFRATSALERKIKKVKSVERSPFTATVVMTPFILRTVISVNQLSVSGAVADLCKELDPDSRNQIEGEICESLVTPTDILQASAISQSSTSLAQGDLLQEYDRKFAELLDDQKWSKLCSDAGFLKEIWERTILHYNIGGV